jgi:hypothetical protein
MSAEVAAMVQFQRLSGIELRWFLEECLHGRVIWERLA